MTRKNTLHRWAPVAALVAMGTAAGTANAVAITITATDPTWSNVVGGWFVDLNDTNGGYTDVRWGLPTDDGQSGLGFNPTNPPSSTVLDNTNFLLGNLRHYNFPIAAGSQATRVDLSLETVVASATPATQTFAYRFFIDETPNAAPCSYPSSAPCADRITFANLDTSSFFAIGGTNYTLELVGFSQNGGATFTSEFISNEGGTSTAGLYARFRSPNGVVVSEPATFSLLAAGMFGALAVIRRRKIAPTRA